MYTPNVYVMPAEDIPLIRCRVVDIIRRTGLLPDGHPAETLVTILKQYPCDELFQIDAEALHGVALGILRLQER